MEKEPFMMNTQEAPVATPENQENNKETLLANLAAERAITEKLFAEVGGIEGIATITTPEIQKEFNGMNPEEFIGKIRKAETALKIV